VEELTNTGRDILTEEIRNKLLLVFIAVMSLQSSDEEDTAMQVKPTMKQ
jgi:hypothetical protein